MKYVYLTSLAQNHLEIRKKFCYFSIFAIEIRSEFNKKLIFYVNLNTVHPIYFVRIESFLQKHTQTNALLSM